jgi:hypothetical protein
VVEVEAGSDEEAEAAALAAAADLPDDAWRGQFEPEAYTFDMQRILNVAEMRASIRDGEATPADLTFDLDDEE